MTPVVLWDVLGTLVEDPFERVPGWLGYPSADALFAVKDPEAWHAFERGELDEADYATRFFLDRREWDAAGLFARIRAAYRWRPGAQALLEDLRQRGIEMHAFSNYPCWYRWIEERLGLSRYMPWSFVSCYTGVRKPHPEAFAGVLDELALDPEALLFVDDAPANRDAATSLGIRAWDPADLGALRRDLMTGLGE